MDEIAARAGVAKQTVYAHFSNKRDLFVAMVSALSNQASDSACTLEYQSTAKATI